MTLIGAIVLGLMIFFMVVGVFAIYILLINDLLERSKKECLEELEKIDKMLKERKK